MDFVGSSKKSVKPDWCRVCAAVPYWLYHVTPDKTRQSDPELRTVTHTLNSTLRERETEVASVWLQIVLPLIKRVTRSNIQL